MKRLNYFQVHKNKKPKKIKQKKYSASKKMIKVYLNVVDNFSEKMKEVCGFISNEFKKSPVKGIVLSVDSAGGQI